VGKTVFVIGDAHFPWVNKKTLNQVYTAIEREAPHLAAVVQIGDLLDLYNFGRWARSFDIMSPSDEILEGREGAENFWKEIGKIVSRKTSLYQIKGNHDIRIERQVAAKFPEIAGILGLDHLWKFKGVHTVDDARTELKLFGVNYIHGYRSKLGDLMRFMLEPVVCGHSHQGGVAFMKLNKKIIWELNAGFIADLGSVPVGGYTPQKTSHKTQGYGLVDPYGPRFCPLAG
jgi:hypothetical protein